MELSPQDLWTQVLERLQSRLPRPAFDTWIGTAKIEQLTPQYLVICAANPFILNHLQKNYLQIIADVVEEILGYSIDIQLTSTQGENIAIVGETQVSAYYPTLSGEHPKPIKLNPKYTFLVCRRVK